MPKNKRLDLGVQYACQKATLPGRKQVRTWVRHTLKATGRPGGQISVRFVDAEEGRRLNSGYRDKDYATNILSFPYQIEPSVCGDLVLCAPVLVREANEQGKSLAAHCAHLVVHGLLHLQGYDHEASDEQAAAMEGHERRILAALGYADPYRDES